MKRGNLTAMAPLNNDSFENALPSKIATQQLKIIAPISPYKTALGIPKLN